MASQNNNIGDQIRDAVQDAISSQDFSKLNETVSKSIGTAVDNIGKNLQAAADKSRQYQEMGKKPKGRVTQQGRQTFNDQWINEPYQAKQRQNRQLPSPERFASVSSSKTAGYFMAISGGVLTAGLGIGTLATAMVALFIGGMGPTIGLVIQLVLLAASIVLLVGGVKRIGRTKLFQNYVRIIGQRPFCDIKELASKTGKPVPFVLKNVKHMLNRGLFRQGYLDQSESCLMVTDEAFKQYQIAEKQLEERKRQEQIIQKHKEEHQKEQTKTAEVQAVLDEGNAYIAQIHRSNDAIPDVAISAKISRMEVIVRKIFQRVEEHPEVISDLQRLMEYYLPTTVKLLDAYEDLDKQPIQGENIASSKREIENTLDTLNVAFEKLLDSIFKDVAWDVSTDISVLHTILAQEGLTEDVFKEKEKPL